ncbi:unnamed protein product [Prunus brigantina]
MASSQTHLQQTLLEEIRQLRFGTEQSRTKDGLALPRGALLQVPHDSRGDESGDCVPSLTGGCDSMDVRLVRALPQLGFMVAVCVLNAMGNEPELPCVSRRKRQPSRLALPRGALLQVPQDYGGEEIGKYVIHFSVMEIHLFCSFLTAVRRLSCWWTKLIILAPRPKISGHREQK